MNEHRSGWRIEELGAEHLRSDFSCGHQSLDEFLHRFAGQNRMSGISRTYVATRADEVSVCGYYSIAAGSIQFSDIPDDLRRRLPRYPIPTALIGRLAVDRNAQGQGLGSWLLMDALSRITRVADSIGIHAVEVVAIDDMARQFYLQYGFTELLDDHRHLYIALSTLKKAGLA